MNRSRVVTQSDIELLDALELAGVTTGTYQPLSAVLTALSAVMSATATAAAQRAALGLGSAALNAATDFPLLAGRAGGQTVKGGTAASENLVLNSTNHATKGQVQSADDLAITTAGKGLLVKEGSNAKMGTAVLSSGTVVVNTTSVTANSRIFLMVQSLGTVAAPSALCVSARTPGVSFTILASVLTDTSVIAYLIFEPA